jgi:hypothetical protein
MLSLWIKFYNYFEVCWNNYYSFDITLCINTEHTRKNIEITNNKIIKNWFWLDYSKQGSINSINENSYKLFLKFIILFVFTNLNTRISLTIFSFFGKYWLAFRIFEQFFLMLIQEFVNIKFILKIAVLILSIHPVTCTTYYSACNHISHKISFL